MRLRTIRSECWRSLHAPIVTATWRAISIILTLGALKTDWSMVWPTAGHALQAIIGPTRPVVRKVLRAWSWYAERPVLFASQLCHLHRDQRMGRLIHGLERSPVVERAVGAGHVHTPVVRLFRASPSRLGESRGGRGGSRPLAAQRVRGYDRQLLWQVRK